MVGRVLPNLGLKAFYTPGERGWGADMSLNLLTLSVLVQAGVMSTVSATPGAPADGDVYLFDDTHPTEPNNIAVRDAGAWIYLEPFEGWKVYDRGANVERQFDGAVWATVAGAYTDENARDAIGAALVAGTGVSVTVNDAGDQITIAATGTAYTDENARDAIGAALVAGTGVSVTVNDAGDTITITNTAPSAGAYTDENARDAIGAALVAGDGITITVNDAGDTITIARNLSGTPYRVGGFIVGTPTSSEVLLGHVFTDAVTFPDDFAGSQAKTETNPTATFAIDVKKISAGVTTTVGTISYATSGAATLTTTGTTVSFAAGDILLLVAPAVADATAANLQITLKATQD